MMSEIFINNCSSTIIQPLGSGIMDASIYCLILILSFFIECASLKLTMTSEVLTVGSAMIDLVSYSTNLPKPGETIMGDTFMKSFGGKGANQAVQCSNLGIKSGFCGRLGNDEFGEEYLNNFSTRKIDTSNIKRSPTSTGVACITVDESGTNTIVVVPSANKFISNEDIHAALPSISTAKVMLCQNEIPKLSTLEALRLARNHGTVTVFNPAPASSLNDLYDLLSVSDIICPNETELSTITGLPTNTIPEIETAGKFLIDKIGCLAIVATLGARGAMIIRKEGIIPVTLPENRKVKAIDTVGAGDCFIGTLASNLARGIVLSEAVRRSVICASISVTRKGAQVSYPQLHEVPDDCQLPSLDSAFPSHINEQQQKEIIKNNLLL